MVSSCPLANILPSRRAATSSSRVATPNTSSWPCEVATAPFVLVERGTLERVDAPAMRQATFGVFSTLDDQLSLVRGVVAGRPFDGGRATFERVATRNRPCAPGRHALRSPMAAHRIVPCIWLDDQAESAASFCLAAFPEGHAFGF